MLTLALTLRHVQDNINIAGTTAPSSKPLSSTRAMRAVIINSALRSHRIAITSSVRPFSTTRPAPAPKNRIYPARVRNEDELATLLLASASTRVPLITLWMTTWSQECDQVSPIIRELIEADGVGEKEGSVSYVEVEFDSPDLGGVTGVATRYLINNVPTLLAFDRQEPQLETRVTRVEDLRSKEFLKKWIETEAARHGEGGAGGSLGGLFRSLFGRS